MNYTETLEPRRMMAAGDIDSTFARVAQSVTLPATNLHNPILADLATDAAGRTYAFGSLTQKTTGSDRPLMYVARFNPDGSRDMAFGSRGVQVLDLAANAKPRSIAIDAAGRINVAYDAPSLVAGAGTMIQLAQLRADGTLNKRFGQNGTMYPRFGESSSVADLIVDAENNLLVVANAANQIGVAKLTPSGRPHPLLGFGDRGVRMIANTVGGNAKSIAIDSNTGSLVIGATVLSKKTVTDFAAIKLNADGTPDLAFGRLGFSTIDFAGTRDVLDNLFIDRQGRYVMSGRREATYQVGASSRETSGFAAMARLNPNGTPDAEFFKKGRADAFNWSVLHPSDFLNYQSDFDGPPVLSAELDGRYMLTSATSIASVGLRGRVVVTNRIDVGYQPEIDKSTGISALANLPNGQLVAAKVIVVEPLGLFDTDLDWLKSTVAQVSTNARTLEQSSVWLAKSSDSFAVRADGRLAGSEKSTHNDRIVTGFNPNGTRDTTLSQLGWEGREGSSYYASPRNIASTATYPRGDGSVVFEYYSVDISDGDGVAYVTWLLNANNTDQAGPHPSDETDPISSRLTTNQYVVSFGNRYSGVDILRQDNTLTGTSFIESSEDNVVPGDLLSGAPIQGSTDVLVAGDGMEQGYYVARIKNGALDPSFGTNGLLFGPQVNLFYGQASGKILYTLPNAAGLRRLNADGTPDGTFGTGGGVMGADFDHFDVDSKGRIIAWRVLKGGVADGDIQIARFTQNGKVDTTFGGGDGIAIVDARLPSTATPNVIIDAQDRLVVTAFRQSATAVSWSATRILGD